MKDFSIIAAVALNGAIGDSESNTIPWYLPSDMKFFRSKTINGTVVMGSRTYRSIGKPLKDRTNIVITRDESSALAMMKEGVDACYRSISEVTKSEKDGFFVIGGQHIYSDAIKAGATNLFITIVKLSPDADVRFPIPGERFLADTVITQTGARYDCVYRSSLMKENDIEYQFTQFRIDADHSY